MAYHLVDKQVIFAGKKIRLEVHTLENDQGKRIAKEVVVHPGAVVILPFIAPDRILMIRNRRITIGQTLLELPAGTLEKGEDPMNCAGRELLEETGYLAGRMMRINSFYSSPGIMSEKMFAFAAYDLEQAEAALEEGEEIETIPVALSKAIDLIRDGEIQDGKTIATLLSYDRFFRS